ncbi:S1 RNA binding domain protein [Minicystis rosea]|nr:S1 RNA binding domain protein [Minicystis rosea]
MTPRMPNPSGSNDSFASLFEQSAGATRGRQRRYHAGESVEVTVVAIAREAVFVELGGKQEGMFDRASLVDDSGKLRVELGSKLSAVVESVDGGTGQVRLRPVVIRTADAGDVGVVRAGEGAPVIVEGARIKGKVTGVERYGVFVQIAGTHGRSGRGLVPTAETATPRGSDLKKLFAVGQDVEAKILSVDETGKIRLSISALGADDERAMFEAFKSKGEGDAPAEAPAKGQGAPRKDKPAPAPRGFGTLGDVLSKGLASAKPAPAKEAPKAAAPAKEAPKTAAPAKPQKGAPPAGGRPKR